GHAVTSMRRFGGLIALVGVLALILNESAACGRADSGTQQQPTATSTLAPQANATSIGSPVASPVPARSPTASGTVSKLVVPWDPSGSGQQYELYVIDIAGAAPRRLTPDGTEIMGSET